MRQQDNKIIFTGPVGAGKTTAIGCISEIEPVKTDARASDMTVNRKAETTVALDYGLLSLDDGVRVHLYGTPGQERFDFMWEIISEGAIGLIVLIDNTRPNPSADLQFFLTAFKELLNDAPLVIGVTKTDLSAQPTAGDYANLLEKFGLRPPILEVDPRDTDDVRQLLMALLFSIDPGLEG